MKWLVTLGLVLASAAQADDTAESVMERLLTALQNNDTPYADAGLETLWEYASPGNKAMTGPLPRFKAMVSRHPYVELIDHQSAEFGQPQKTARGLSFPVRLITQDGQVAGYIWTLEQQDDDRWLTNGVRRVPIGNSLRGM